MLRIGDPRDSTARLRKLMEPRTAKEKEEARQAKRTEVFETPMPGGSVSLKRGRKAFLHCSWSKLFVGLWFCSFLGWAGKKTTVSWKVWVWVVKLVWMVSGTPHPPTPGF